MCKVCLVSRLIRVRVVSSRRGACSPLVRDIVRGLRETLEVYIFTAYS